MSLKIVKNVKRDLTDAEIEGIKKFRSYTDGIPFACLNENVMIMVEGGTKDADIIKEKARKTIKETQNAHPDFEAFDMNDGNTLVLLWSGVAGFAKAESDDTNDTLFLITVRNMCLMACEENDIIAVAYEEE